ncbi:hypothetical protein BDP27DRAFT_1409847 [Rhodocollybia butyracea]|uniref:Uncharacterized protein n=1 Tax=Rhodocollybia butyracea TaxID=206335 RepID=A0A9P5P6X1_9AGAR|nr:hypothetical protein BDP27DRAFT_1409847 [Rhodocollybia butyracea]
MLSCGPSSRLGSPSILNAYNDKSIQQLNYLPLAQILCASSLHGTNPPFYISALNHGCEILALLLPIKPTSADTADRIPQGSKFTLKGAVLCAQPALRLAG